jgi:hypothetical protein
MFTDNNKLKERKPVLAWEQDKSGKAIWLVPKPFGEVSERGESILKISYEFKDGRDLWIISILNGIYEVEREEINREKVMNMAEAMLKGTLARFEHINDALN